MEDQDKRTEEQEDVEAHLRKKHQAQASEDAPASEEGEDEDFELHRKSPRAL